MEERPERGGGANPEPVPDPAGPTTGVPPGDAGPPLVTPPPATPPGARQLSDKDARTFGMLAHLAAFSGFVIPFGHLLGPLLVWLIKREEHPFVDDQGRESFNFQLSMSLYYVIGVVLLLVLIGFLVLPALVLFSIVVTMMGAIRANAGERFRYPLCIRFIR